MAAESDGDPRVVGGEAPDPPDHIEQSIREIVRDEQEKQAEEQAEQQGRYLARIGLTRRQVLAIAGGSALGGTLLSAFSAERARAAATGEIGTAADPLNILRVANLGGGGVPINVDDHLDLQSSQEIQNAAAIATELVDITAPGTSITFGTEAFELQKLEHTLADSGKTQLLNDANADGFARVIRHANGIYADFQINSGTDATIAVQSGTFYTTTEGSDDKANVYWDAGNSRFELNNEAVGGATYTVVAWVKPA